MFKLHSGACCRQCAGINLRDAVFSLGKSPQVPGRLETGSGQAAISGFRRLRPYARRAWECPQTLRELEPHRLIAVLVCGGNRDRQKRPLMAEIVDRHADHAIITSDNPRKENPDTIIAEIEKGFRSTHYEKIVDRTQAINRAIELARPHDIVLIAGKGHENYQEFADHTIPFGRYSSRATCDRRSSNGVFTMTFLLGIRRTHGVGSPILTL